MPDNPIITAEQLLKICPTMHATRAANLVGHFNFICPQYGMVSKDIFHEFFANLCEESGLFTRYEENLNYSSDALIAKFGRHRISNDDAIRYGRNALHSANQKMIATLIYGGQWGMANLGNVESEDGWIFRGSGPIQITGRGNFTQFAKWMETKFSNKKTPALWAELLRTSDEFGIHSACWIFSIAKQLNDEAANDDMKTIVKRINGGLMNYEKRLQYYELAKKYIV
jgi:putative chitinase